jgi:hypothetical protein
VISQFHSLLKSCQGIRGEGSLARKKPTGTPLKIFSGKEATLNRIIFLILCAKNPLASYDIYKEIRNIKGLRHTDSRTVFRRVQALENGGWISEKGTRPAKPGWDSAVHALSLKGQVALSLSKKNINDFLETASDEQLRMLLNALE